MPPKGEAGLRFKSPGGPIERAETAVHGPTWYGMQGSTGVRVLARSDEKKLDFERKEYGVKVIFSPEEEDDANLWVINGDSEISVGDNDPEKENKLEINRVLQQDSIEQDAINAAWAEPQDSEQAQKEIDVSIQDSKGFQFKTNGGGEQGFRFQSKS